MEARQTDPEVLEAKLEQLIDARIYATENDVLVGRKAIVRGVAEQAKDLNCDADEAEALVRAAVLGHSQLVGARIYETVKYAIYAYVLPLAQQDLADAERAGADTRDDNRIGMAECDRLMAA
jgi:hypothetical protein